MKGARNVMSKQEAETTFQRIRTEYNAIKSPKYRYVDFEEFKLMYQSLLKLKEHLIENKNYQDLVNAMSQILARLEPPKNQWLNITERGVNKAIPPVIKKGKKEILPFQWEGRNGEQCTIDRGYWGRKNYMLMDILGAFFLLKQGDGRHPEISAPLFRDLESIGMREDDLNECADQRVITSKINMITESDISSIRKYPYWVRFDDKYFRQFTGLNLSSNKIFRLILDTSRVEFKLTFPVRLEKNGKKKTQHWYPMNFFSRFFEFGYFDKDQRSDGFVVNREYYVIFNTILGELFVSNLTSHNFDYLDNSFYKLPDLAQVFYKTQILHHTLNKMELYLENFAIRLNLKMSNRTMLRQTIENNILNPLCKSGFIKSYRRERNALRGEKYIMFLKPKKKPKDLSTVFTSHSDDKK